MCHGKEAWMLPHSYQPDISPKPEDAKPTPNLGPKPSSGKVSEEAITRMSAGSLAGGRCGAVLPALVVPRFSATSWQCT